MHSERVDHFSPYSPLFKKKQSESSSPFGFLQTEIMTSILTSVGMGIIASDIGLTVMASLLVYAALTYGSRAVLIYYFIPYMVGTAHLPCSLAGH